MPNQLPIMKRKLPFDILDSIRGIAALYVTIAHCRGSLWMGGNEFMNQFPRASWDAGDYLVFGTSMLTRLAVEFVILFFLLSGFSIAHSLSGNKSPVPFYQRRFVRIYPSYITALIWAGLVFIGTRAVFPQWYDGTYADFSFIRTIQMNDFFEWKRVLGNLLYLPGEGFITPFWSLTFEIMFYLVAPFVLRKPGIYITLSFGLFAAHWALPGWLNSLNIHPIIYQFLFVYNVYFAAGVLLYQQWDRVQAFFTHFGRTTHRLFLLLCLALMYAVNFWMRTESEYSFMVAAILAVILISYFIRFEVRIKWLMNVGKFSYTLYITHLATIFLFLAAYWLVSGYRKEYITAFYIWPMAIPLCIAVAYGQYWLVEKNTKAVLERMRQKTRSKKEAQPTHA